MLTDMRSVVMVAAMLTMFSLPLVTFSSADPYQPIRALVAAVASAVLVLGGRARWSKAAGTASALLLGLLVWLALSAALNGWAPALFGVHGRFQGLVSAVVMALAFLAGLSPRGPEVRGFGVIVPLIALVMAAIVIGQVLVGRDPAGWTNNRVVMAGWFAVVISMLAAFALVTPGRGRWLIGATAAVCAVALGLTGSRGAWLAVLAGVAVAAGGALRARGDRNSAGRVAAIVAVVLLLVGVSASLAGEETAGKLDPTALASGSAASRMQIWRGAAAMAADRPVFGYGPGRFLYGFPLHQPFQHARIEAVDTRPDQAHSWPLQLMAEGGLPAAAMGVAIFATALYAGASGVRRRDATALVATAGLAAYGVQALFGVASIEVDAIGWFAAGLAASRGIGAHDLSGWAHRVRSAVVVSAAAAVALACVVYLTADVRYARALDAFAVGDMRTVRDEAARAVRLMPLVDVYRVAFADGALYEPVPAQRTAALAHARDLLEEGLMREPASYDLALALARVHAASGESPDRVADAYLEAVRRYPLGVEVRTAAVSALRTAGRTAEADEMQAELDRLAASRGAR